MMKTTKRQGEFEKKYNSLLKDWRWFGKRYNKLLKQYSKLDKILEGRLENELEKIRKNQDIIIDCINTIGNKIEELKTEGGNEKSK